MNRVPLIFQAKRLDNGEWVCSGTIVQFWDDDELLVFMPDFSNRCICEHDGDTDAILSISNTEMHRVDPATVRQPVGLFDKNNRPIYNRDIVRIRGDQSNKEWKDVDYIAQIVFLDGGYCAIDGTVEEHGFRRYALARMDFDLEVIGNIFDNPELVLDSVEE